MDSHTTPSLLPLLAVFTFPFIHEVQKLGAKPGNWRISVAFVVDFVEYFFYLKMHFRKNRKFFYQIKKKNCSYGATIRWLLLPFKMRRRRPDFKNLLTIYLLK